VFFGCWGVGETWGSHRECTKLEGTIGVTFKGETEREA